MRTAYRATTSLRCQRVHICAQRLATIALSSTAGIVRSARGWNFFGPEIRSSMRTCSRQRPLSAWLRGPSSPREQRVFLADADMTSSDRVHELFKQCRRVLRQGIGHVVIDLHNVRCADTKLLACIIALYQLARSASVRLEICLSNAVLDLARVCRLEWLALELARREAEAVPAEGSLGIQSASPSRVR